MKRITMVCLSVLLAICMSGVSVADESSNARREYFSDANGEIKAVIQAIVDIYKTHPEQIDADAIFLFQSYISASMALNHIDTAELVFDTSIAVGKVLFREGIAGVSYAEQEKTWLTVENAIAKQYGKWLDGEKTDEEFMEYLVNFAESVLLKE